MHTNTDRLYSELTILMAEMICWYLDQKFFSDLTQIRHNIYIPGEAA